MIPIIKEKGVVVGKMYSKGQDIYAKFYPSVTVQELRKMLPNLCYTVITGGKINNILYVQKIRLRALKI